MPKAESPDGWLERADGEEMTWAATKAQNFRQRNLSFILKEMEILQKS